MTGYKTQCGHGEFCLQFETNDRKLYEKMEAVARECVDLELTSKELHTAEPPGKNKFEAAIERLGTFGRLFVDYKGCPKGPLGICGPPEKEVYHMGVIVDTEGQKWIPVDKKMLDELVEQYKMCRTMLEEAAEAAKADLEGEHQ